MFVFALYSIILSIKMLRSPLFPNHAFNFIFYSLEAHLMNAPETTLVCVGAMKLKKTKTKKKKKQAQPFCSCLSCSFYIPAFVLDER